MKALWLLASIVCAAGLAGLSPAHAQDAAADAADAAKAVKEAVKDGAKEAAPLPECPVMGEPIDFTVSAKTDAGPVYFCCAECVERFEKDPAKYAAKADAQRAALRKRDRVQARCPVGGEPLDGKTNIEHEGQKIGFCCSKCADKFKADPASYAGKLEASFVYQTICPVAGRPISAAHSSEVVPGQRVYFCCEKCAARMAADPAKYAPKLAAQGVNLDLKKVKPAEKP